MVGLAIRLLQAFPGKNILIAWESDGPIADFPSFILHLEAERLSLDLPLGISQHDIAMGLSLVRRPVHVNCISFERRLTFSHDHIARGTDSIVLFVIVERVSSDPYWLPFLGLALGLALYGNEEDRKHEENTVEASTHLSSTGPPSSVGKTVEENKG
jgi:hypothetical protein